MENAISLPHAEASNLQKVSVLIGCALGMAGSIATVHFATVGIFLKAIAASFHWSRSEISACALFFMVGLACGSFVVGRLFDRYPARRILLGSGIVFAVLLALLSMAPGNPFIFALLNFVIGFGGVATGPAGYVTVISRVFSARRGAAIGFSMIGVGLGAAVMPLVAHALLQAYDWRIAYRGLALIALLLAVVARLLLRASVVDPAKPASPTDRALREPEGDSVRDALHRPMFWLLMLVTFVISAISLGAMVHLPAMFTDRGISPGFAARAVAVAGLGVALGRVGVGMLLDKVFAPWVAAACFMLGAIGIQLVSHAAAGQSDTILGGAILIGFIVGSEGDFVPYFVTRYFGLKHFGFLYGLTYSAFALGGVAGPTLFGRWYDSAGNYSGVLAASSVICVICAGVIFLFRKYRF